MMTERVPTDSSTRLANASILLTGIAYGGFGLLLLLRPETLGAVGVAITRPAAAVELRGFYGGLELGVAAFFFLALRRPAWHAPALTLQAASLGGAAAGRAFGLVVGGGAEPLILMLLVAETVAAAVGVTALAGLRRTRRGG